MNRLAQFLNYTQKVFALNQLLRRLRDGRCDPPIALRPVVCCEELSRKALAHELDLALEADLPWELWFAAG